MNNGSRDVSRDIQKLQQQLQDIKDQVHSQNMYKCTHDCICSKSIQILLCYAVSRMHGRSGHENMVFALNITCRQIISEGKKFVSMCVVYVHAYVVGAGVFKRERE